MIYVSIMIGNIIIHELHMAILVVNNVQSHIAENEMMEGQQAIPIQPAQQPMRPKGGRLHKRMADILVGLYLKL